MKNMNHMLISGYFRRKKKEWRSISIVIFLCVLFFTSIISSCLEAVSGIEQYTRMKYGNHQFQAFQVAENHKSHPKAHIGTMELKGYFLNTVSLYYDAVILGVVDDSAKEIGNLSLSKGRMPKEKGEIAIESSVLERMHVDASVGDKISLPVFWVENGQYQEQSSDETFLITGIIKDYSRIWMTDSYDPYRGYPGIWISDEQTASPGVRVELLQFDDIQTLEQADKYYQELSPLYDNTLEFNINTYIASEDDSTESRKSMYLTISAWLIGCVVIIIMMIGIMSILSLGIEERKKQQQILYQLGMSRGKRFFILCEQIYLAAFIGIVPGILCSVLLIKGLKILLFRMLGIYASGQLTIPFILISVFPILLVIGIINVFLYQLINKNGTSKIKRAKNTDFIQRILNGSFSVQRICSILLLTCSLLVIIPIQGAIHYYQSSFLHPLEKDISIRLESLTGSGSLQISEGRQGVTVKDYDSLTKISGLEDTSYAMQLESAKILLPDGDKESSFLSYRSDSETVPKIENIDIGDGTDYVLRDKLFYGYAKEDALIPCTIQGLEWNTIQQLSDYLIEGNLDQQSYINGEETLAVVWEEEYEKSKYPIHIGDTLCLTNLVQTKLSENYFDMPDEAHRTDSHVKIGGILKIPISLADELGCVFTRGSYTFLRSLEALEEDGHVISFQSISFNYDRNADKKLIDENIKKIISHYNYVTFESKYEKQKAEQEFRNVVLVLGGSIFVLGLVLSILLIYQKMISTMLLKKRQLYMMWCLGMHHGYLRKVVIKEGVYCVASSILIAITLSGIATYFWPNIDFKLACLFILSGAFVAFTCFLLFTLKWIHRHFYTILLSNSKR